MKNDLNLALTNWEKARGDICPRCNHEALRFHIGPHERLCITCFHDQSKKDERKLERRALIRYFRKYGTLD